MNARQTISLVAWREIRERLRSRVFLYSTLLMLVVVGAASALPAFINTTKTYHVAVVASAPPGLDAALQRAAKPFDARVKLQVATRGTCTRAAEDEQGSTPCSSCRAIGSPFTTTSTRSSPRSQTAPFERCAGTCRRHPSSTRSRSRHRKRNRPTQRC